MIQVRRGKTESWKKSKVNLAAGQPGYDKDKHKLKIGDGESSWDSLPYVSGLSAEEIINSEANAKRNILQDPEDRTIITYGPDSPNDETVGRLYLHYYETEPQVDFVVASGVDNGWFYQKWHSGIATCSKVFEVNTSIQTAVGSNGFYKNSSDIAKINYPFNFITKYGAAHPIETATIQSPGGLVWIAAAKGTNTSAHSASYSIMSADKLTNNATYRINLRVEGYWR